VNCKTPHLTMTDASGWPELQWRQLNPFRLQTTCCCLHIYLFKKKKKETEEILFSPYEKKSKHKSRHASLPHALLWPFFLLVI